jgi:hypothetical protein
MPPTHSDPPRGRQSESHVNEVRRLLELCAADQRIWQFVKTAVERDAVRIDVEDYSFDQGRGIIWNPPSLPTTARAILQALKPVK